MDLANTLGTKDVAGGCNIEHPLEEAASQPVYREIVAVIRSRQVGCITKSHLWQRF